MRILINASNIDLDHERVGQVIDKLGRLDKYLQNYSEETKTVNMRISRRSRFGYRMNFSLRLPEKKHLYANAISKNFVNALVNLREQLEKQIHRFRNRHHG